MVDYAHFAKDPGQWEELTQMLWGSHNICPFLTWFKMQEIMQLELLALSHRRALGNIEKTQGDIAFLLIEPRKTIEGEMAFGLAAVWAHPHQAWLSSLDETVKKLTLLIILDDKWVYALCSSTRMPNKYPSLIRVTLVP